ncbi:hypothetical protein [Cellulomonas soli]|uniref:ATP synthase protein I n=1 Tax=Cellulomonas soli TaxID=931535 RepID=A0A512PFH4_9CELL|nr:hypothetical protein [Cellulomonas soli]NYI59909.1 hypothetical protein [Cellulomonas soli]GEP69947.1 hypothetical protein CSO01_26620 [Cellulomonas soli]
MTTDPGADRPDATVARTDTGAAVDAVFRRALRDTLLFLGVLTVLGVGLGALLADAAGVWGALIGVGFALVFCGTTVVVMLRTAHANPQTMAIAVMGSWLAKLVVVIVVLALLRGQTFYDRVVLLVVVAVGTIGSALLDYRAVAAGRIPYVEPTARQDPSGE